MSSERLASDDPTGEPPEPDCWVFDVDGCLADSHTGSSLRPGARAVLEHLARRRREVIFWSAGGAAYAQGRAVDLGLPDLVGSYFAKNGRDDDGCYLTAHLPTHRRHAVYVDDRPEDLAPALDVIAVSPYLSPDPFDRGFERVCRRAGLVWPRPRQ